MNAEEKKKITQNKWNCKKKKKKRWSGWREQENAGKAAMGSEF